MGNVTTHPRFPFHVSTWKCKRHLLLLFFSLKISAIFGDAFILPRSLDGASTTREYLILSFSRFFPPFCLRESTAEREREREILISVSWCQEYTAYLSSSSLSLSFGNGRNDIKRRGSSSARPRLVCWKLVRSRLRTCIGACPWPGTKANTGLRHEAELDAFDMSWFITTRSVWRT